MDKCGNEKKTIQLPTQMQKKTQIQQHWLNH